MTRASRTPSGAASTSTCCADILANGVERGDRTGTGTLGVFGRQMRFDLAQGFPLLTTKQAALQARSCVELLWFLRGDTNVRWLQERGVTIWDEWADADGELGPGLRQAVALLDRAGRPGDRPDRRGRAARSAQSRRAAGTSSPPGTRPSSTTWRCRPATACSSSSSPTGELSCQLYQRSADVFLGVPFNIASYALLTMMMAQATGLEPGEFVHTLRRRAPLSEPSRPGEAAADPRAPALPDPRLRRKDDIFAFDSKRRPPRGLRGPPGHQGADRGLSSARSNRRGGVQLVIGMRASRCLTAAMSGLAARASKAALHQAHLRRDLQRHDARPPRR